MCPGAGDKQSGSKEELDLGAFGLWRTGIFYYCVKIFDPSFFGVSSLGISWFGAGGGGRGETSDTGG
jgi:hypothetical protein